MREAFRVPGFARLYAGLTASMLGDSIMLIVLSMWVKTLTDSNAMAGLTFFFMVLPAAVAPLLGVWVDRFRRLPVLVWGNLASAVGVLPLVLVRTADDVWIIWSVAFLYGISFIVVPAALNGLLKELVPETVLVSANSATMTTKEAFRLFGPLVGAWMFSTMGGWSVAVLDSASFVVAALVIGSLRRQVAEVTPERVRTPFLEQAKMGFRHLAGDRILRHVTIGFAMMLLVLGFAESTIYAVLDSFGKPATFASVLVTCMGVGAIAGGLTTTWLVRRFGEVGVIVSGLALMVMSVGGISASPSMAVVLVFSVVLGTSFPIQFIALNTLVQRRTPSTLMGRVSATLEILMATPQAISLALGSALVLVWDWRLIFTVMAAVTLLGTAWIAVWLRDLIGRPLPSVLSEPPVA